VDDAPPDDVEWDAGKARRNRAKHGVSFNEAASALQDPLAVTKPDLRHSDGEDREFTIGRSKLQRIVVVAHVTRGTKIRIISARVATAAERNVYQQGH